MEERGNGTSKVDEDDGSGRKIMERGREKFGLWTDTQGGGVYFLLSTKEGTKREIIEKRVSDSCNPLLKKTYCVRGRKGTKTRKKKKKKPKK